MTTISAQQKSDLPYYEIPDYPGAYSSGSVAARVIDGLGFRYYWATEGLRQEDLNYKPVNDSRTTEETTQHLYSLTNTILNTTRKLPNVSGALNVNLPFDELRKKTLENIKAAADILRTAKDSEVADMKVILKNDSGTREFPFWNILNGPVDDALWHVGQVIMLRRASGNPYNNKASVFTGKVNP
jgi:tryptophanase